MLKIIFAFLISLIFYKPGIAQSKNNSPEVSVIPQPVSLVLHSGYFSLNATTAIISADKGATNVASFLAELLHENYGFSVKNDAGKNSSLKPFFFAVD